jgi:hypothetical protein
MPKSKKPLNLDDHNRLVEMYEKGMKQKIPVTLGSLALAFGRNKARILKELRLWKGFQRFDKHQSAIKFEPVTMDEVKKEYGEVQNR